MPIKSEDVEADKEADDIAMAAAELAGVLLVAAGSVETGSASAVGLAEAPPVAAGSVVIDLVGLEEQCLCWACQSHLPSPQRQRWGCSGRGSNATLLPGQSPRPAWL